MLCLGCVAGLGGCAVDTANAADSSSCDLWEVSFIPYGTDDEDIQTEVLDMLEKVARLSKDDHLIYIYRLRRDSLGRRPTAVPVVRDR